VGLALRRAAGGEPVRTGIVPAVEARLPASPDDPGLWSSWVFAVEEVCGSAAAGWMTEATSFYRSPRSVRAFARTPRSSAFFTGGRMLRAGAGGETPGPGAVSTGDGGEGLLSTTVGMLVMDDGVGTARGFGVIARGVGEPGAAPRAG